MNYPSPCDTCVSLCPSGTGCAAWKIRYRYRQKQINAFALRLYQNAAPAGTTAFCYPHPDEFRRTGLQGITCISGGFPCQPHSVIGKRLAENDERHLWPEFVRVVRELKPKYVVGENVNGLLSTIHESVCSDLEAEGYGVWTFCVPACAVGAHHERYRVCILGIAKSQPGLQADTKANPNRAQWQTRPDAGGEPWNYLPGTYWAVHQPPVCGMDDGIPAWMGGYQGYKQRMQCYGNAVVPQQFYPIFRAIAEVEGM